MKILLVLPPFGILFGYKGYFPIGLASIASYLNKNNFNTKIYNADMQDEGVSRGKRYSTYLTEYKSYQYALKDKGHKVWQGVKDVILNEKPDIVGVSVMTAKYESSLIVSEIAKECNSDSFVVWGGPHPTIRPDEVLQNKCVDFAVRKEGELTFLELCQFIDDDLHDFSKIKGISYKKNGKIYHNDDREYIKNLDILPFPDIMADLHSHLYSPAQKSVIVTSRGCPFNCGYCGAQAIWTRRVRFRSTENIILEIKRVIGECRSSNIFFWDDSFTANRERIVELCEQIISDKIKINFHITTRVDIVDYELLKLMKEAGLSGIDFGIETGSPNMLDLIDKGITQEKIIKAVSMCDKIGIVWNTFFMIGFPDETEEDIDMTMKFIKKLKPYSVGLSIFTPYPETPLYDRAVELSLIPEHISWSRFSHHSPDNHFVKKISQDRFQEIVFQARLTIDAVNQQGRIKLLFNHPVVFFKRFSSAIKPLCYRVFAGK
ncbi:MAG: radical SAM protein [Candidatus Electrothrix sp. ATG1]|nr:radical SAM protein [Candidatus Electrothrix sp. ATG1]